MKNIFKILLIFIFILLIFFKRNIIVLSTIESIELFNKSLFPSIFPIMILSDFILSTNFINILSNTIGKVFSKIFNLKFDVEWVYKERRRVSDEINEILVGI